MTQEIHYENFRAQKLGEAGATSMVDGASSRVKEESRMKRRSFLVEDSKVGIRLTSRVVKCI